MAKALQALFQSSGISQIGEVKSRRYSMLVQDGVVQSLNMEEGGAFTSSSAEEILKQLQKPKAAPNVECNAGHNVAGGNERKVQLLSRSLSGTRLNAGAPSFVPKGLQIAVANSLPGFGEGLGLSHLPIIRL